VLPLSTLREALVELDPQENDPWAQGYATPVEIPQESSAEPSEASESDSDC